MPEIAAKVKKTYQCRFPMFAIARPDEKGKRATINFVPHDSGTHGEFSTDDPGTQAYIEASDPFQDGRVYLAPSPLEVAEKEAEALRALAVEANAKAKAAEDAVAALQKE